MEGEEVGMRRFLLLALAWVLGLGVFVAPAASDRTIIRLDEPAPPSGQPRLIGALAIAPDFQFPPSDASMLIGGYAPPPSVSYPSPVLWFADDPTRSGSIVPHTLPGTPFGAAVSINNDGTVGGTI